MQMDVQRSIEMTTSWDQELVKENAKLKAEITTLRKQLQDKEFNPDPLLSFVLIPLYIVTKDEIHKVNHLSIFLFTWFLFEILHGSYCSSLWG